MVMTFLDFTLMGTTIIVAVPIWPFSDPLLTCRVFLLRASQLQCQLTHSL